MKYMKLTSNNVIEVLKKVITDTPEGRTQEDHYKCECGALSGKDTKDKVCDKCQKKVKFMDVLIEENLMYVIGITHEFVFDKDAIEEYKEEIFSMLLQLPRQFRKSCGGGWSFLMACEDIHGHQWTGMHLVMEQLFCMGIAIEKVKSLMPREMWVVLPGSVPYYIIDDSDVKPEDIEEIENLKNE